MPYGSFFGGTSSGEWFDQRGVWLWLAKAQDVLVYFNFEDGTLNFVAESLERGYRKLAEWILKNDFRFTWLRGFSTTALKLAIISHPTL